MTKVSDVISRELFGLFVVAIFGLIFGGAGMIVVVLVDLDMVPPEKYTGVLAVVCALMLTMCTWIVVGTLLGAGNDE